MICRQLNIVNLQTNYANKYCSSAEGTRAIDTEYLIVPVFRSRHQAPARFQFEGDGGSDGRRTCRVYACRPSASAVAAMWNCMQNEPISIARHDDQPRPPSPVLPVNDGKGKCLAHSFSWAELFCLRSGQTQEGETAVHPCILGQYPRHHLTQSSSFIHRFV